MGCPRAVCNDDQALQGLQQLSPSGKFRGGSLAHSPRPALPRAGTKSLKSQLPLPSPEPASLPLWGSAPGVTSAGAAGLSCLSSAHGDTHSWLLAGWPPTLMPRSPQEHDCVKSLPHLALQNILAIC